MTGEIVTEMVLWGQRTPPGSDGVELVAQVDDAGSPGDPRRTVRGIGVPTLTAHRPSRPNGAAAVVMVGGGYTALVVDKEGTDVARWLNSLGITGFVLKNRLPGEGHAKGRHVPLQDAQRALRLIRARSADWRLDPNRIGAVGLSSGGHMAAMLGTHWARSVYDPADHIDAASARPDFLVLGYGPYSGNARDGLINAGQPPLEPAEKQALYDTYPIDRQVGADTPPAFLVATDDDRRVDALNSVRVYMAMRRAGVPCELHIFKDGGHGFAIRETAGKPVSAWTGLCEAWLATLGIA